MPRDLLILRSKNCEKDHVGPTVSLLTGIMQSSLEIAGFDCSNKTIIRPHESYMKNSGSA